VKKKAGKKLKMEDGARKMEDGGQRAEDRGQKIGSGGVKISLGSEVGDYKAGRLRKTESENVSPPQ
jgi:hypothetical protein